MNRQIENMLQYARENNKPVEAIRQALQTIENEAFAKKLIKRKGKSQMTVREQKELKDTPLPECPECLRPTDQEELDMFGGVCENCRYTDDE